MTSPDKFVIDSSSLAPEDHRDDMHVYRKESWLHFVAREGRVALRVIIICSLVGVLLTMWTPFLFLPLVPLTALLVSYVLLTLTNEVQHRAAKATAIPEHREAAIHEGEVVIEDEDDQPEPVKAQKRRTSRLIQRESAIGIAILACLIVAAFVLARVVIPAEAVLIAGFFVFAYMLLLGAPFWLGMFNDDIDAQSRRVPEQR